MPRRAGRLTATPRMSSDRLELVPLTPEDAVEMVGVLADPGLYTVIGGAPPTLAELEERYRRWAQGSPRPGEDWHNCIVRLRDGGAAIGHLQATVTGKARTGDIAWLIGAPWQGRGYAAEAVRALVAWLEEAGVDTITAHIAAGHAASERVAAAAGLAPTDEIEDGEVVWRRLELPPAWRPDPTCLRALHTSAMPDQASCNCGCPNTFDTKAAEGDLKRYRKQGPDRTTRALIDALVAEGVAGATLLDIGGGIGAIQLALLEAGAEHALSVDATEAYVAAAHDEAERRGFAGRTEGRVGLFEAIASEIEPADVVTLDRVVCCDPNLPGLLGEVAQHARRVVGLVYPRETWWNRLAARVMAAWSWLTRDTTRWHLHAHADIDAILGAAGFVRRDVTRTLIWQVALFVKS